MVKYLAAGVIVCIALSSTCGITCASEGMPTQETDTARVSETPIAALPESVENVLISADGRRYDYITRRKLEPPVTVDARGRVIGPTCGVADWKVRAVVDGAAGPEYDNIESLIFSPDGARSAYVGRLGAKRFAVIDGQPSPEYTSVLHLALSPDGRRVAYAGRDQDLKWSVAVDGVHYAEPEGIHQLVFSPDGSRVAWVARGGDKWVVVVDGVSGPAYVSVSAEGLVFSADGRCVAYEGWGDYGTLVVVDGTPLLRHTRPTRPTFSPDGKRLAYIAVNMGASVVVDDVPGQYFTEVGTTPGQRPVLTFSRDGSRLAYVASRSDERFAVVDDRISPSYQAVHDPVFSPNGARVAYAASRGGKWFVVVDDALGPEHDGIADRSLVFSADGRRLAYAASQAGKQFVVVDGVAEAPYDAIAPGGPVLSPDGKAVAYVANVGEGWSVFVDGAPGPAYDSVSGPVFIPDGRKLAYRASSGKQWRVVVDGEHGPWYDEIWLGGQGLVSAPDGSLEYFAKRDKTLYRVRHAPRPG